jgi:hypothetical protein
MDKNKGKTQDKNKLKNFQQDRRVILRFVPKLRKIKKGSK